MVSQHRCPYCNSSNLDWMKLSEEDDDSDTTYRNYMVTCLGCHRAWYFDEVYEQTQWQMIDIEGNIIGSYSMRTNGPSRNTKPAKKSKVKTTAKKTSAKKRSLRNTIWSDFIGPNWTPKEFKDWFRQRKNEGLYPGWTLRDHIERIVDSVYEDDDWWWTDAYMRELLRAEYPDRTNVVEALLEYLE